MSVGASLQEPFYHTATFKLRDDFRNFVEFIREASGQSSIQKTMRRQMSDVYYSTLYHLPGFAPVPRLTENNFKTFCKNYLSELNLDAIQLAHFDQHQAKVHKAIEDVQREGPPEDKKKWSERHAEDIFRQWKKPKNREGWMQFVDASVEAQRRASNYSAAMLNAYAIVRGMEWCQESPKLNNRDTLAVAAYAARLGGYTANQCERMWLLYFFTDALARIAQCVPHDPYPYAWWRIHLSYIGRILYRHSGYPPDAAYCTDAINSISNQRKSELFGDLTPLLATFLSNAVNENSWTSKPLDTPLFGRTAEHALDYALDAARRQRGLEERCVRIHTVRGNGYLYQQQYELAYNEAQQAFDLMRLHPISGPAAGEVYLLRSDVFAAVGNDLAGIEAAAAKHAFSRWGAKRFIGLIEGREKVAAATRRAPGVSQGR
jgi:hypothetical protein